MPNDITMLTGKDISMLHEETNYDHFTNHQADTRFLKSYNMHQDVLSIDNGNKQYYNI